MPKVAGLLLAAGESTRMEAPKALLPWHGRTLLEHQVATLTSADISPIIVVLGHQPEKLEALIKKHPGVTCVYNPDFAQGKTTSIKAGLRALQAAPSPQPEWILLLNVDQPRSSDTIRQVIDLHQRSAQEHLITVPTHGGKGGHPVILSISLMEELMEISEENAGLKAVVSQHETDTLRVEMGVSEILLDLNTPEEYRKAIEL